MSRSIALQPVVTQSTPNLVVKPSSVTRRSIPLKPKVTLAGSQTITPGPS